MDCECGYDAFDHRSAKKCTVKDCKCKKFKCPNA